MIRNGETAVRLPLSRNGSGSGLIVTTLAMMALGVVMVYSALAGVLASTSEWHARSDMRHMLFAIVAALFLCFGWRFRYRWLGGKTTNWPMLATVVLLIAVTLAALVYVPGLGHARNGKLRWLKIAPAPFGVFQPSELLKIAMLVFLAAWLSRDWVRPKSLIRAFVPAIFVTLVCVGLVVREDLGTAVIMGSAALLTMFLAGVSWYLLAGTAAAAAGGFWYFVSSDPSRMARIEAMINPWCQSNPSAYQPRQSLLAILSGGWFGKGLGRGIVKQGYLPERSTDFIFASFTEEWGFVGAILLMGLVIMWIWFARKSAVGAPDRFGRLLAGSLGAMIAIQMVLHIAVDLVAAPPTGMSFPFVSVGGTAMLMAAGAAAMIVSVSACGEQGEAYQPSKSRVSDSA